MSCTSSKRRPSKRIAKGFQNARRAQPESKDAWPVAEELRLVREAVNVGAIEITRAAAGGDLTKARELAVGQLDEQQRLKFEQRLAGYRAGKARAGG